MKQPDLKHSGLLLMYRLCLAVALFIACLRVGNSQVIDTLNAQNEFILPSNSCNIGVSANLASYKIKGATTLSNVGFEPALSFAAYSNFNKLGEVISEISLQMRLGLKQATELHCYWHRLA